MHLNGNVHKAHSRNKILYSRVFSLESRDSFTGLSYI